MADNPCIVTINGTDYYYPCDRKDDLVVDGNYLINVSSSTVTLYADYPEYQNSSSGFPRITCPTNTKAYYRATSQSNQQTLTVNSMQFKTSHYTYSVYIMFVILGVLVCQLFKR